MIDERLYAALPRTRDELIEVIRQIAIQIGAVVVISFPDVTPAPPRAPVQSRRPQRGFRR